MRPLYIKFEDIKINVISEEPVGSLLTLFLETSTSMDQIYSLFVKNPLYEIILYDANNKMLAVRVGYEIIESFTYNPINNYYMMVLSKKNTNDIITKVNKQGVLIDELCSKILTIKEEK